MPARLSALFFGILVFNLAMFASFSAEAGEGLFGRVYTTETVPEGHYEIEQTIRNRRGRSTGDYSAYDFKSEFEYGFTDDFQGAFYVNTNRIDAHGAPDDDDPSVKQNGGFTRHATALQSLSAEFIYRVMSPMKDVIGLAFYFEPTYMFYDLHNGLKYDGTIETEYRILVQKNFFDDQLILAYNMAAEIEFIRFESDENWKGELDWNHEFGISYRFMPNWFGGLEVRNHNEVADFRAHDHSVYWAGPTIHYGGPKFWSTLGVLRQFYGVPNSGRDENGTLVGSGNLFLRSHEKWEITFKLGVPF